jgi:[ribosomal protein S18]-alanine N-acetyltransferase
VVSSPTFWTAVAAVGTVVALLFIQRQLKHARHVSAYEFLRKEDDRFREPEMRGRRSDLALALLSYPEDYEALDEVADYLLDYFEDLGLIIKSRLAPPYFMWTMNCYYVLRYWHGLHNYITWARAQWEDRTLYADFEYLYRAVSKVERRETGRAKIEFTQEEIREFLQEELSVVIRHSTVADLQEVLNVERATFKIDDYPEAQFRELYEEHPNDFFVAELFEKIVGYAVGYVNEGHAEFDSIAVTPRYQRLGIGTTLTQRLIQHLSRSGAVRYTLEVRTSNTSAEKFYERLGFRIIGTEKAYYSDGGDAAVMEMLSSKDAPSPAPSPPNPAP